MGIARSDRLPTEDGTGQLTVRRLLRFGPIAHRQDRLGLRRCGGGVVVVHRPCGCRLLRPCRSCGRLVLVEDAAEPVSSEDVKLIELAWF
jgi:hypothetical protein